MASTATASLSTPRLLNGVSSHREREARLAGEKYRRSTPSCSPRRLLAPVLPASPEARTATAPLRRLRVPSHRAAPIPATAWAPVATRSNSTALEGNAQLQRQGMTPNV